MGYLLIQSDNVLDNERIIILDLLSKNKYLHSYSMITLNELKEVIKTRKESLELMIPIGTIDFVTEYLKGYHNIEKEVPIEIPKYLQTEEFLKRNYRICRFDEIPTEGRFFLKDVSKLKEFGMEVNTSYTDILGLFNYSKNNEFDTTLVMDKSHLFQVSDILNIKSEYRVYVIGNEIKHVSHYDGDATLFPDISLIKKAKSLIEVNEKHLRSYTIDVAVGDFGTALIEIHNFTSVGLYSTVWGSDLLYGYIDGINYLTSDNSVKYL